MPEPRFRSRSKRRVQVKTPGAKTVKRYLARKPNVAKCANCREELKGIPRMTSAQAKNSAKSKKTVSRPYGGSLCSKCARAKLKSEAKL